MHARGDRTTPLRTLPLAALAAFLALPAPAAAQEPTPEQQEAARLHFEAGVPLAQASQWAEALVEFEASVAAMPTAVGLLNVGLCQRNLGRNLDAQLTFERFMTEFGATAEDVDRQDVENQLRDLRALLGRVAVRVDAAGAQVEVAGRPIGAGPIDRSVPVEPGDVVVIARLEGLDPVEQTVQVAAGQSVPVVLEFPTTSVAVEPPPPPPPGGGEDDDGGVDPVWFWTSVGITGAAAVAWGVTGGLALAKNSDYADNASRTAAEQSDGQALALGADICGAIAGAAAVATVVLIFFTDWDGEAPDDSQAGVTGFSAGPVADGLSLGVVGRF
ncbi:MAG: PEGA domain-containing protein [Deltaproteobacteria bacterium]|nr:PEGA domain-containing protein [Deltaproteobacteria bacterium]